MASSESKFIKEPFGATLMRGQTPPVGNTMCHPYILHPRANILQTDARVCRCAPSALPHLQKRPSAHQETLLTHNFLGTSS